MGVSCNQYFKIMEKSIVLNGFERYTFDKVQEMVHDTSRKLGKSWSLDYDRVSIENKQVSSTVSIYEGEKRVFHSFLGDNVAEACMYAVAFLNGIDVAIGLSKSH